jgi:hypothetical protein
MSTPPPSSEPRRSWFAQACGQFLGTLAAKVALGVITLAVGIGWAHYIDATRKAKITETQRRLELKADEYSRELDSHGLFVRHAHAEVDDAWGQPCVIRYSTGVLNDDLAITSPGADARLGTWDDLTTHRKTPLRKTKVATKVYEKVSDFLRD